MKIFVDNRLVRQISQGNSALVNEIFAAHSNPQFVMLWPTLLEYLDLGTLFKSYPKFDQSHKVYNLYISTLTTNNDKELFYHLYDHLFAECLSLIKALPQIDATFLMHKIYHKRESISFILNKDLLSPSLEHYEKVLINQPYETLHDLTLFLAWDRMCTSVSRLFDYQSSNSNYLEGVKIFKECLIESFQHITDQGRTAPSFFRMMEALFFYHMREENLQSHPEGDWELLSQSFNIFKQQDELADILYIDESIYSEKEKTFFKPNSELFFTSDSQEQVTLTKSLAQYTLHHLKNEVPGWHYNLADVKILPFSTDSMF